MKNIIGKAIHIHIGNVDCKDAAPVAVAGAVAERETILEAETDAEVPLAIAEVDAVIRLEVLGALD